MRSKLVIDKINEMKMKLGSKVIPRRAGKTKVDSEISIWTLASSEMQAERIEQLVSIPWKAVLLRYFEEAMRTTPRIHALIAEPYQD